MQWRMPEGLETRGFGDVDRTTLGIPSELPPSLWWEQYDAAPIIDAGDEALVAELRARIAQAH